MSRFYKKVVDFCLSLSDFQTRESCFFRRTFSPGFPEAHSTCPLEHLEETFFRKSFLAFFKAWAKIFWLFLGKFYTGSSKLRFTRLEEQFEENFFEKKIIFQSFSDTKWGILGFLSKTSQKGCQNCILPVHRNHSKRRFSLEFFRYFRTLTGNIPLFLKIFRQVCQNWFLRVTRKFLRRKYFQRKAFFIFFVRTSIEKILAFCRKFFHRVVKTAFYVSMATFWFFLKFSDVGQKTIVIVWQTFPQGCQNCFPGVPRNKVSRNTFRWKPYILLFRHWAERFYFFLENCMTGLSELLSTRQKDHFEKKYPLWFPPHQFRTLGEISSGLCRIFIHWVVKTAYFVSRRNLRVKYILQESCTVLFITFGLSDNKTLLSGKENFARFVQSAI